MTESEIEALLRQERHDMLLRFADRMDAWVFPAGSDALEPMFRLVRDIRAEAEALHPLTGVLHRA